MQLQFYLITTIKLSYKRKLCENLPGRRSAAVGLENAELRRSNMTYESGCTSRMHAVVWKWKGLTMTRRWQKQGYGKCAMIELYVAEFGRSISTLVAIGLVVVMPSQRLNRLVVTTDKVTAYHGIPLQETARLYLLMQI